MRDQLADRSRYQIVGIVEPGKTVSRTLFARPYDEPLKILIFQTIEASTYEQAVGKKKTERKKPCAYFALLTSSASPRATAKVVGTINSAKMVKVSSALIKPASVSMAL